MKSVARRLPRGSFRKMRVREGGGVGRIPAPMATVCAAGDDSSNAHDGGIRGGEGGDQGEGGGSTAPACPFCSSSSARAPGSSPASSSAASFAPSSPVSASASRPSSRIAGSDSSAAAEISIATAGVTVALIMTRRLWTADFASFCPRRRRAVLCIRTAAARRFVASRAAWRRRACTWIVSAANALAFAFRCHPSRRG